MASKKQQTVEWEDPPEKVRYDWEAIAKQLRARPGEWAKVFEQDRATLVNAIRLGGITAIKPDKGFEWKTRNNKREVPPSEGEPGRPRMCDLYLRYVPSKDKERK